MPQTLTAAPSCACTTGCCPPHLPAASAAPAAAALPAQEGGGSSSNASPPTRATTPQNDGFEEERAKRRRMPAIWQLIPNNILTHRKRKVQDDDDVMICQCKPTWRGGDGCGPDCINRMLCIECVDVSTGAVGGEAQALAAVVGSSSSSEHTRLSACMPARAHAPPHAAHAPHGGLPHHPQPAHDLPRRPSAPARTSAPTRSSRRSSTPKSTWWVRADRPPQRAAPAAAAPDSCSSTRASSTGVCGVGGGAGSSIARPPSRTAVARPPALTGRLQRLRAAPCSTGGCSSTLRVHGWGWHGVLEPAAPLEGHRGSHMAAQAAAVLLLPMQLLAQARVWTPSSCAWVFRAC